MFLIGLTGGIASGKSTVSSIFQDELNMPVVDADSIAREGMIYCVNLAFKDYFNLVI